MIKEPIFQGKKKKPVLNMYVPNISVSNYIGQKLTGMQKK